MELRARALLFDMDGVLVDSRGAIDRVRRRWARRCGLDEDMVAALPHGRKTSDIVRHLTPSRSLAEEVAWLDADEARDLEGIAEIPGARSLLGSLEPGEWAVVTSSGRELALKRLAAAGLPVPRVLVAGDMVRTGKPSPEGYLRGASDLGVSGAESLVLEDAPAGIEAGLAAGARVIGVATTSAPAELTGCAGVVNDLSEIAVRRVGGALTLLLPS